MQPLLGKRKQLLNKERERRLFVKTSLARLALCAAPLLVQAQDIGAGQDAAMLALNTLMALLAGLLFGNLLVSARRNL